MNTPFDFSELSDVIGEQHIATSIETPMRSDAFDMNDLTKIYHIQKHFKEIMHILGLDLSDDSLRGTPQRVAKMFVTEVFSGLNPANKPDIQLFKNKYQYNEMLIEKNITLFSYCEHHFVPIMGRVHVGYISTGNVIGLSKINRIVQYYGKRPQVQERLTNQIAEHLKEVLETEDVALVVDAMHLCVASRGINDTNSSTVTSFYSGRFTEPGCKAEFLSLLNTPMSPTDQPLLNS
jgi:GTP cyclohydrolase I